MPVTKFRRIASAVSFRSADLLGGPSLVVPAGQIVRLPTAPRSLAFQGFNTLSFKMAVAGLGGGDALVAKIDTLDPESPAGGAIPSGKGQATILTATGNGDWADTFYLKKLLASAGLVSLPISSTATGTPAWGVVGAPTIWQALADESDATYAHWTPSLTGLLTLGMQPPTIPAPTNFSNFRIEATLRAANSNCPFDHVFQLSMSQIGHPGFVQALTWKAPGYCGGAYPRDQGLMTNVFAPYIYTLTPAEAQDMGFGPGAGAMSMTLVGDGQGAANGIDVARVRFIIPGGGVSSQALLFTRNMIVLDNTGSASDATVSNVLAELTNA